MESVCSCVNESVYACERMCVCVRVKVSVCACKGKCVSLCK